MYYRLPILIPMVWVTLGPSVAVSQDWAGVVNLMNTIYCDSTSLVAQPVDTLGVLDDNELSFVIQRHPDIVQARP